MKRIDDSALLTRYLLGDVSEEEQTRLEQEFLADDDRYQQLVALEDELRYDYAQGHLTPKQRESFERRFMASPADRQKVDLARSVLAKAHATVRPIVPVQPVRSWPRILADFFAMRPVSFTSAALAATAGVCALIFFTQTLDLRNELQHLQVQRGANQVALNQERSREQTLTKELQQERTRREQLEKQAPKPNQPPLILAFTLAPGLTRDTEGPRRLKIPADAQTIRMQLQVRAVDRSSDLRASLQNLDGVELWSQELKAAGSSVTIELPAQILSPGDFMVELKGASGPGSAYYFTSVR